MLYNVHLDRSDVLLLLPLSPLISLFSLLYGFSICRIFLVCGSLEFKGNTDNIKYQCLITVPASKSEKVNIIKLPLFFQMVYKGVKITNPLLPVGDSIDAKLCLKCKKPLDFKRFFLYQLYC